MNEKSSKEWKKMVAGAVLIVKVQASAWVCVCGWNLVGMSLNIEHATHILTSKLMTVRPDLTGNTTFYFNFTFGPLLSLMYVNFLRRVQ